MTGDKQECKRIKIKVWNFIWKPLNHPKNCFIMKLTKIYSKATNRVSISVLIRFSIFQSHSVLFSLFSWLLFLWQCLNGKQGALFLTTQCTLFFYHWSPKKGTTQKQLILRTQYIVNEQMHHGCKLHRMVLDPHFLLLISINMISICGTAITYTLLCPSGPFA